MNRKLNFLFLLLLVSSAIIGQTTYTISDPEELEDLTLVAGDEVILEDGTYSSDERIKLLGTGTAELPITFRPETPGGVIFDGGLKLSIAGEYLVVDGFYWNGGFGASNFIQFRDGTTYAQNCTIQNCAINGLGVDPDDIEEGTSIKHRWVVLYGNYNNVLNCSFMNKSTSGALVLVELEFNASPDGEDGVLNTRCVEVGHTISNNYFYKYDKIDTSLTNAGDSETIRVGESEFQNVSCATTVSNNYFVESDGENEIISNKSDDNFYINNTFRRCRGSLVLRHGSGATVEGNYFLGENVDGTGGLRISDSDHVITNNYIQNCVTTVDQAIWNNGITFMGGNTNTVDDCNSTSTSNGYQDAEDVNISNNTIINTNAPLFFNINRGKTDNTGIFANNLVYFDEDNANLSTIISGDEDSSYADIGETISYSGNVFSGTTLGETNDGFSSESISLVADGEVFTHNQAGKGAAPTDFVPFTDAMVGDGIGACFLDYLGGSVANPTCTIEIADSLTANGMTTFTYEANSGDISVNTNVSWIAASNDEWITIDTNSGTDNAVIVVTVTENEEEIDRIGSITLSQEGGGITRTITITQEAAPLPDPRLDYILINDNTFADNVTVESVSDEEVTETKNNIALNSLDKDFDTNWSGNGIDAEIIYDLGGVFDLGLIDYLGSEGKTHDFQIWTSTSGIQEADFEQVIISDKVNERGNLNTNSTDELEAFVFPSIIEDVKFVKIKGFGQPGGSGSTFNTITEIEFYGNTTAEPLPDPRLDYVLINDNTSTDNVTIEFVSDEEVTATKNNIALNSLDKDFETNWSGNGVDAEIIYNLGGVFDLGLIDYLGSEGKTHDFQIWTSTSGIQEADFEQVVISDRVNERGNLNTNRTNELQPFLFPSIIKGVKFVKIKGFGQPGGSGSTFNTITEIEFYGNVANEENNNELCDFEEYDSNTVYAESGETVIYNGAAYENQWYTRGQLPTNGGPWELIGFCGQEASDCSSIQVWSSKIAYGTVGSQVVYNQNIYENKWYILGGIPGEDDAWELSGFCDTVIEEGSGELCDSQEYDSNTIYAESGITVIYNGIAYENEWYTQGQLPVYGGPWKFVDYCDVALMSQDDFVDNNSLVQIHSLSGLLIKEYTTDNEPEELILEPGIYIIRTTNINDGTITVDKVSF